jgi:hypothetical protein
VRTPVLVLQRQPLSALRGSDGRWLLPLEAIEPYLVTHTYGLDGFDPAAFSHTCVGNIFDDDEARRICRWLIEHHGLRRIVALHEKTILMAAELREAYDLPGQRPAEAMLFRDKVAMKAVVAAAGVDVPDYRALDALVDLDGVDWAVRHVIKPRFGVGSDQVHVVSTRAEAAEIFARLGAPAGTFEIEKFIDGDMYHCDAVVLDGAVNFASVGRYYARPGHYRPGGMAGSYLLPPGALRDRIVELNSRALAALGLREGVTHLEVFHTPTDDLVFCEAAARPGGGGIDEMVARGCGLSLYETALRLAAGMAPPNIAEAGDGAWARIGFYPAAHASAGIPADRFGSLGIVSAKHDPGAGDSAGAAPRHCTDYAHRYVVTADDHARLVERIEAVRSGYEACRG